MRTRAWRRFQTARVISRKFSKVSYKRPKTQEVLSRLKKGHFGCGCKGCKPYKHWKRYSKFSKISNTISKDDQYLLSLYLIKFEEEDKNADTIPYAYRKAKK